MSLVDNVPRCFKEYNKMSKEIGDLKRELTCLRAESERLLDGFHYIRTLEDSYHTETEVLSEIFLLAESFINNTEK